MPEKKKKEVKKKVKEVVVLFEGGRKRIYSEKEHGKNFMELAKEFVSKDPRRKIIG